MATANKIVNVADRVQRAKEFLLSQFKDKPNINSFVEVVVAELQELENAITDMQDARTLNGSYGIFLDEIGKRLKVSRGNYADNDYKTAIKIAMAKKTASATAQDILYLVELLTADTEATLTNNYPYLVELTGYLYCIADDPAGLSALADLFPVNTRVRLIQHYGKSFKFGTTGRGFGSGSTLNNLAYYRYGVVDNPLMTVSKSEITPPALVSAPFILVAPYIIGDNQEGSLLQVELGEWGGDEPITYNYQWLRDNVNIGGETTNQYTISALDLGLNISCRVTATNTYGELSTATNSVLVKSTPTVPDEIVDGLGVDGIYVLGAVVGATYDASVTFNSDGTTSQNDYLSTTGVGAGDDYTISYIIVDGQAFGNLNPNQEHTLSSPITFTISDTVLNGQLNIVSGTYTFTIRNTINPAIVKSTTITLTVETDGTGI